MRTGSYPVELIEIKLFDPRYVRAYYEHREEVSEGLVDSIHNSDASGEGQSPTKRAVSSRSECAAVGNEHSSRRDRKCSRPVVIQMIFCTLTQSARDEAAPRKRCNIVPEEIDDVIVYLVGKA